MDFIDFKSEIISPRDLNIGTLIEFGIPVLMAAFFKATTIPARPNNPLPAQAFETSRGRLSPEESWNASKYFSEASLNLTEY